MASQKLPSSILLPEGLNYIKGQSGVYVLLFESDIDKATYFLGRTHGSAKKYSGTNQRTVSSEKKKKVWEWLQEVTGWNELQRREHRKLILEEVKRSTDTTGDPVVYVPDLYTKHKTELEEEQEDFNEDDEKIPEGLDELLKEIESESTETTLPKPKKTRAKKGELTKKQQEILHNILEDLIKIKYRLTEIKKNQEDKIAYEKRRDRLNAERLAFLERERQIEALPESPTSVEEGVKSGKEETPKKESKKPSWFDPAVSNAFKTSLFSILLGGGSNTPQQNTSESSPVSNFYNTAKYGLKAAPIPGINMIPFAEGGIIGPNTMLPFGNGTQIQPLDAAIKNSNDGATTFSRGFGMEDLKSPLAEVMKLPLKVAGAALLSAISNLSKQFDISDPKLQSDLSKMISDISKAFGLNRPTFGAISVGETTVSLTSDKNDEQGKLISEINTASSILVGEGEPTDQSNQQQNTNTPSAPNGTSSSPPAPSSPTPSGTTSSAGNLGTSSSEALGTSERSRNVFRRAEQGESGEYIGGSSNIVTPLSNSIASASESSLSQPLDDISSSANISRNLSKDSSTLASNTTSFSTTSNYDLNFNSSNQSIRSIANEAFFNQLKQYQIEPGSNPIINSMSVAMGLPPVEAVRDMISSKSQPSIINLPPINQKQKLNTLDSEPERVNRFGKSPYGSTNVAFSIRSQVLA